MAVNQGGSQAVVLQLQIFCASSSVSLSLCLLVFTRWHCPYQEHVKTVYSVLLQRLNGEWKNWWLTGEGGFTLCCCRTRMHTRIRTHTHQMVQEGGLNKHTCTDTHLLADRRLRVCAQRPLMKVYGESKGPSSFSWLSMRCSIMTMVIRSPIIIHRSLCQSDSFL